MSSCTPEFVPFITQRLKCYCLNLARYVNGSTSIATPYPIYLLLFSSIHYITLGPSGFTNPEYLEGVTNPEYLEGVTNPEYLEGVVLMRPKLRWRLYRNATFEPNP